MKIAIISPNPNHLREMSTWLEAKGHAVIHVEGGKSRMRLIAEQEVPDLMLVDGMCRDPHELGDVEVVTTRFPRTAVILLCATQSHEFLIQAMRVGVREVLPSPATAGAVDAAVARVEAKLAGTPRDAPPGKIIAFMSCKGGSGATFLATNVAWQLAESRGVLLIDLNLQFGDALGFLHDGPPVATLADVTQDISRLDASLLAASTVKLTPNLSVLAAPEDLARAVEVRPDHLEKILTLATSHYEFVVLDLDRRLDALTVKALDRAQRIYAVLQAALPSVRHATRLLEAFRSLGYPSEKVGLILNRYEKSGPIGLDQIRRSMGEVTISTVANSYREVSTSINHGDALAKHHRSNLVTRQLAELCESLNPRQDAQRSLLNRLLRRA